MGTSFLFVIFLFAVSTLCGAQSVAISPKQLRVIDRTNLFEPVFLRNALDGKIPGVDSKFILDVAWWFHHTSIPCCEKILTESRMHNVYNCTALPAPTDHASTQFLFKMIFECIGERKNVTDCCWSRGVRSKECLSLCDTSQSSLNADAFEGESGSEKMGQCAAQMRIPKPRFLWMLFDCLNPDFSKITRLTQVMQAQAAKETAKKEKQKEKEHGEEKQRERLRK